MNTPDPSPSKQGGLLSEYLSDAECAHQLGIHHRTLARWDRLREGPRFVKFGRRKLRRREAVLAWLKSRERVSETV